MGLVSPDRKVCARRLRSCLRHSQALLSEFKDCEHLLPLHARKPRQEIVDTGSVFEILEKSLHWHARPLEQPRPTDFPRNALYRRTLVPIEHFCSIAVLVWRNKDRNHRVRDFRCDTRLQQIAAMPSITLVEAWNERSICSSEFGPGKILKDFPSDIKHRKKRRALKSIADARIKTGERRLVSTKVSRDVDVMPTVCDPLFSGCYDLDKTSRFWDLNGETEATLPGQTSIVDAMAVSPHGRHVEYRLRAKQRDVSQHILIGHRARSAFFLLITDNKHSQWTGILFDYLCTPRLLSEEINRLADKLLLHPLSFCHGQRPGDKFVECGA
jgi:hypothetical protein